jgi:hypothetical protein
MTQSMNGVSFYTAGINDTDNLTVNNISCNNVSSNNISSNGIITNTINTTNLTGTTADFSGIITGQNIYCQDGFIVCYNGDIVTNNGNISSSGNITATGNLICNELKLFDPTDSTYKTLTLEILENLFGLTTNVQKEFQLIRKNSALNLTSGTGNLALGSFSLISLTTGSNNIGIGNDPLPLLDSGSEIISIGSFSGGNVLGNNNICIGLNTGQDTVENYSNSVALGTNAQFTDSNQIVL